MLGGLRRRFRPDPLRVRVEDSIRRGTGLSRGEWVLEEPPHPPEALTRLSGDLVAWCRERIAETRRPYGIDHLALAVACAEPGGSKIASTSFGVFRPMDFYREGGIAERVEGFLESIPVETLNERGTPVRFAAALFSWGDVARETIFADR
jgi:hypothetical protein